MPEKLNGFGAIENWDGNLGLGIINASFAMQRAIELAREHGIGLVALRNTNHWFRAATYACRACDEGMAAMCFSNTSPNMPAWGAEDSRLGNNPLTLGFPGREGHVVADLAMSQFSYGKLELAQLQGKSMPVDAGFNEQGILTRDPGKSSVQHASCRWDTGRVQPCHSCWIFLPDASRWGTRLPASRA